MALNPGNLLIVQKFEPSLSCICGRCVSTHQPLVASSRGNLSWDNFLRGFGKAFSKPSVRKLWTAWGVCRSLWDWWLKKLLMSLMHSNFMSSFCWSLWSTFFGFDSIIRPSRFAVMCSWISQLLQTKSLLWKSWNLWRANGSSSCQRKKNIQSFWMISTFFVGKHFGKFIPWLKKNRTNLPQDS